MPSARAVGGVKESRGQRAKRLLTRDAVLFDLDLAGIQTRECPCCRRALAMARGLRSCSSCRWHRLLYRLIVLSGLAGLVLLGPTLRSLTLELAPFAAKWTHTALIVTLSMALGGVVAILLGLTSAPSGHCHWGAVHEHIGQGRDTRTVVRNREFAVNLAEESGTTAYRVVREPRSGWTALAILTGFLPVFAGVYAAINYSSSRITLHVDNGSTLDLRIRAKGHGELGVAPAGKDTTISLPRMPLTLTAQGPGGETDEISAGGLSEILDGRYGALFPDLEYDVADVFVWNVMGANCYESSTKSYGMAGLGSGPKANRQHVFPTDADALFKRAPASVMSEFPMEFREELLRVPCR